jgi:iron complex transport system substrate-binding protein/vitamin B12 transport system substrate-binding protein
MRNQWLIACSLFFLLTSQSAWAAISVQDGKGQTVTVKTPAKRIVALTPHAVELLFSAGAGGYVVGATQEADYPPSIQKVSKVGTYNQISLEAILRLKPDLVVTWQDAGHVKEINRLKQLGIPVFVSHPLQLDQISQEIMALSVLSQTQAAAQKNTQSFQNQVSKLKRTYQNKQKVKTLVAVSEAPLYTVSNHSFLGQLVNLCGGTNVFGSLKTAAAQVSKEAVMRSQAQVVFVTHDKINTGLWQNMLLPASKNNRIFALQDGSRPSLRLINAATQMCQRIDAAR